MNLFESGLGELRDLESELRASHQQRRFSGEAEEDCVGDLNIADRIDNALSLIHRSVNRTLKK